MGKRTFALPEAAREAGVTEEELRRAIRDGLLLAHFLHNTGEHHVDEDDLRGFMRRTRRDDTLASGRKRLVLMLDDQARIPDLVKLDLSLGRRLDVRHVSWGPDAGLALRNLEPTLLLLGFRPPGDADGELLAALQEKRTKGGARILAYADVPLEFLRSDPAVAGRMDALGAEDWISTAAGARRLLARLSELLGPEDASTALRRQA